MANRHRGGVNVTIGGKERELRYTLNALADLQDRLNLNGMSQFTKVLEDMDFRTLRIMLWAGLIHQDPDLKVEDVGSWRDLDIQTAAQSITAALQCSFGESQKSGNGLAPAVKETMSGTN